MKKYLIVILFAQLLWGAQDSTTVPKLTEKDLSPNEKVLAGVLVLQDAHYIKAPIRNKYYQDLLAETGVTHQEFKKFLTSQKSNPVQWQKTMDRLKLVFF